MPGLVVIVVPAHQRSAQRATGIPGRGLNPDILERTFAQNAAVRNAVQCHTTGET